MCTLALCNIFIGVSMRFGHEVSQPTSLQAGGKCKKSEKSAETPKIVHLQNDQIRQLGHHPGSHV
jgi:hypothetical protein